MVLALVLASVALGEPTTTKSPAQRALDLGYEGDDLFARGKWADAYDRFKEADDLAHSPAFVLYMARCRRNAGQLVDAEAAYTRVATEPVGADAPKPFRAAVDNAAEELAELKKKIPTIRVEVLHAAGDVDVRADGKPIAQGTPTEMDPGAHELRATNAGKNVKKSVTLAEGSGETRVDLDFASSAATDRGWGHGSRAWGAIAFTIASASAAGAIVTGSIALRQRVDVASRCTGAHCSVKDASEIAEAYRFANASTGLWIFGGINAVAGTVLIIVRPGHGSTSVAISPAAIGVRQSF